MNDGQETVIFPFQFKRVCEQDPDQISQIKQYLTLKPVDNIESIYTRKLVKFRDAGLPSRSTGDTTIHWDLFLTLHYRQDWRPSGYGLGDLIYTISLLPNEELTLEVKTWETDRRLEEMGTDLETKNTSDIQSTASSSSDVASKVETKEKEYVDAKAGYSGFGASLSVSGGWSQEVGTMNQENARQAQENAQKACREETANQKTKIAVSRESGSESKTTRKIRNVNQAHTLNVNFFEVLKEYEVILTLYQTTLMMLGEQLNLRNCAQGHWIVPNSEGEKIIGFDLKTFDEEKSELTWGQLIRFCQSRDWIQAFTDCYGFSPISVLRQEWSLALRRGSLIKSYTHLNTVEFQTTLLQYVQPSDGWVEPDENGNFRWAYEIIPGKEKAFLKYMYHFVPTQVSSIGKSAVGVMVPEVTDIIRQVGPFYNKTVAAFYEELPGWVQNIVDRLQEVREYTGVVRVGDDAPKTVTLPTQGVYADLSLVKLHN